MNAVDGDAQTNDFCSIHGDACGWMAAAVAALCYGTYGVPIKSTVGGLVDVHPLVMQSYKTLAMAVISPLIVTVIFRLPLRFTPWGLVSGTLWVTGGTAGIYAIRTAGLATAVGIWAAIMMTVSFGWGFGVFHERVQSLGQTAAAFVLMGLGLLGMSRETAVAGAAQTRSKEKNVTTTTTTTTKDNQHGPARDNAYVTIAHTNPNMRRTVRRSDSEEAWEVEEEDSETIVMMGSTENINDKPTDTIRLWGKIQVSRRVSGILGAVCNGLLSGSSLIPVHFAQPHGFGGANYFFSYAMGALLANGALWLVLLGLVGGHWQRLPSWHVSQLGKPGVMAGVLLTMAMLGSVLSVTYLGQGVGNSLIQSKLLISGLWGICWFHELQGRKAVLRWFAWAAVTVTAILWLCAQRVGMSSHVVARDEAPNPDKDVGNAML